MSEEELMDQLVLVISNINNMDDDNSMTMDDLNTKYIDSLPEIPTNVEMDSINRVMKIVMN
jgi:hypothetical protein